MKTSLFALAALALALQTADVQADDDRRGWDNRRGNDREWNDNRRWDNRWDNRGRGNNRANVQRWDNRGRNNTRVNVNVNVNNRWRPAQQYNNLGYSIGIGSWGWGLSTWSTPIWGARNRQPVVVYQNNYIEQPVTRTVVKSYSSTHTGTSILRDISGRCFERQYDSYGNETRIEIPLSMCNF